MSTKRGSSDEFVEVNVEVTERPTGTFQIGAGFSSIENFIATAQIAQHNLFGRGQTLSLLSRSRRCARSCARAGPTSRAPRSNSSRAGRAAASS